MIDSEKLWQRVDEVTRRERGRTLATVPTTCEIFEEDGVPYQIRQFRGPHPKREARREQRRSGRNPFLPPEPDLLIGDVSATHVAVLNKFNVFGGHLLLVTRDFRSQEEPLDPADFEALVLALIGVDGLGFFNGGKIAGASQEHKHLQIAPLPLAPATRKLPTPVDAALADGGVLPFPHALRRFSGEPFEGGAGADLHSLFTALVSDLGVAGRLTPLTRTSHQSPTATGDVPQSIAFAPLGVLDGLSGTTPRPSGRKHNISQHLSGLATNTGEKCGLNLLLTRRWMMVVPRSREKFETVSINALGFAGSLLARNDAEAERIREVGPGRILRSVSEAGQQA